MRLMLMCVMHSNGASCIVTYDVPFFSPAFDAKSLDPCDDRIQFSETLRRARGFTQSGQVYCYAGKPICHSLDDTIPEMAARGNAVEKQNGVTGTLREQVHFVAFGPELRHSLDPSLVRGFFPLAEAMKHGRACSEKTKQAIKH